MAGFHFLEGCAGEKLSRELFPVPVGGMIDMRDDRKRWKKTHIKCVKYKNPLSFVLDQIIGKIMHFCCEIRSLKFNKY